MLGIMIGFRSNPAGGFEEGCESMRVVIVNCYNDNNRGSAALNFAAIEMVMRAFGKSVDISLVPLAHDNASSSLGEQFRHTVKRYPEVAIADPLFDPGGSRLEVASALRHWRRASGSALNVLTLERIASADLVVSRGGVILHGRTSGVGGTGSLATRTMALRTAQELGVRTVVYGAQVGPFLSKGSARLASRLLSIRAADCRSRPHLRWDCRKGSPDCKTIASAR